AFMANKAELTNQSFSLKSRLRLFEAVVTPAVLYGGSSWALKSEVGHKLQTAQRRMLRMLFGSGRRRETQQENQAPGGCEAPDARESDDDSHVDEVPAGGALEPWVDWIKRVIHHIEEHMNKLHIDCWWEAARRKIWKFAARIANMPSDRWAVKAVNWIPELDPRARGRLPGRPRKRWADDVVNFLRDAGYDAPGGDWISLACNVELWMILQDGFMYESI
ncbi:unnamed protein product, partial [Prorocentrum cordatum]